MAVIDLDRPVEARPVDVSAPAPAVPFSVWLRVWAPLHPVRVGVVLASAIAIVATIIGLAALVLQPVPQSSPANSTLPTRHAISISVAAGGAVQTTVVQRDETGDLVLRGRDADELLAGDNVHVSNVVAVVLAVEPDENGDSSCQIMVDGRIVDRVERSGGGQAVCLWLERG